MERGWPQALQLRNPAWARRRVLEAQGPLAPGRGVGASQRSTAQPLQSHCPPQPRHQTCCLRPRCHCHGERHRWGRREVPTPLGFPQRRARDGAGHSTALPALTDTAAAPPRPAAFLPPNSVPGCLLQRGDSGAELLASPGFWRGLQRGFPFLPKLLSKRGDRLLLAKALPKERGGDLGTNPMAPHPQAHPVAVAAAC